MTDRGPKWVSTLRRSTLLPYAGTLVDQVLFSLAGFTLSWLAANQLSASGLAAFAISWQWALGIVAVGSEVVVTPAVVATASGRSRRAELEGPLAGLFLIASGVAGVATLAAWLLGAGATTAAVTILAGCAGTTFTLVRGLDYAEQHVGASLAMNLTRLLLTLVAVGLLVTGGAFAPVPAVAVGASAFLLPLFLPRRRVSLRLWENRRRLAAVPRLLRGGLWYGMGTAVRFIGFSAGLLIAVELTRSTLDAAAVAGLFVLAGPTQLLASSLPTWFMVELSAERSPAALSATIVRQAAILLGLTALAIAAGGLVYGWWLAVTIGDPDVAARLAPSFAAFATLVGGIIVSSYGGAVLKALEAPVPFVAVTMVAGVASLLATLTPVPSVWIPSVPYLVSIPLIVLAVARLPSDQTATV